MKPFLKELAERIIQGPAPLDKLTFIFPNRRAVLYFRKHVSQLIHKPAFAPRLLTIEDFIGRLSPLQVPDKLELVYRLYKAYHSIVPVEETFDTFYFWGEMLLGDFDEVDKYHVQASHLFKDLSYQKELDASFDFLTEEQQAFLMSFWSNFHENLTENKKKFLHVWKELYAVYQAFREALRKDGLAYEGMLHRDVAEQLQNGTLADVYPASETPLLHFVGFNALTKAEEMIIRHFVAQGTATAHWDLDEYYVNSDAQEAGAFFRTYQKDPVLSSTFLPDVPAHFRQPKSIHLYSAPQPVAQTKLMAQVLQDTLLQGADPEDTLVVLPDEKLLLPVLHGIANSVEKLNVTMGFPLTSTPLFNMIELLMEMQLQTRDDHYNHRYVLALLGHPYTVAADAGEAQARRKEILSHNWVQVEGPWLRTQVPLYDAMFREADPAEIIPYLRTIINTIGTLPQVAEFDKEYALHFIKLLNRLEEVPLPAQSTNGRSISRKDALKSFLRLLHQLVRMQKIPFSGEPLRGLQVMGVLETRNLDFKNVFILSLNEGAFPAAGGKGSYIPHNLRRAYGLTTLDQQDAIYAYQFYRCLQRAENIHLFYNSETDVLGQGEMSRYLQQLVFESGLPITRHVLHSPIQPHAIEPIVIHKDESVFNKLARHCMGQAAIKELTPTALNDYLECRLKFYYKHVARIKEADEIEEDLDARMLGNFLHEVMELFYQHILDEKKSKTIEPADFEHHQTLLNRLIDHVFRKAYHLSPTKPVVYEGQRLVVREIIISFANRILAMDKAYAPFNIEALERRGLLYHIPLQADGNPVVVLGGIVDRADSKDGVLRVVDYKTGKDVTDIKGTVSDLFVRDGDRNKAAFQTLLYALLYKENTNTEGLRIVPGLMNRINLFDDDFRFGLKVGKDYVHDITPLLPEFEAGLKETLEELYNPDVPFDQTLNTDICRYCPYRGICYRG